MSLCKIHFTFVKNSIMHSGLLFPNKYKKVGSVILIISTILGIILLATGMDSSPLSFKATVFAVYSDPLLGDSQVLQFVQTNIIPTVTGVLFIIGALLVGFSKEKNEDEYIASLRLSSLLWAVFVNYILLLISFIFIYGMAFLSVMLYNMFTVLIIFIARFNYLLFRNSKMALSEK